LLYDILAVLWGGEAGPPAARRLGATQGEIALGVAARTGRFPSEEVCDGHLWFLTQFGFVEETENKDYGVLYSLTQSGSALLSLAAGEESAWKVTR